MTPDQPPEHLGRHDRATPGTESATAAADQRREIAQGSLAASEVELRQAQRVAHVGSWRWVAATDTVTWSDEYYRIAGLDAGTPPPSFYHDFQNLWTAESWTRLEPLATATLHHGIPFEGDFELVRPDGSTRWIAGTGEAVWGPDGTIVGLRGIIHDITDRRAAEQALRERADRLRLLVDEAVDGVFHSRHDGRMLEVNPAGCAMLGYAREQLLSMLFTDFIDPHDLAARPIRLRELQAGETISIERVLRRSDGSPVEAEIRGRMLAGGDLFASVRDITEQKRAQDELMRSEAHHRLFIEEAVDGIFRTSLPDNRILDVNPAGCAILGRDRHEVVGLRIDQFIHPDDFREQPTPVAALRAGRTLAIERRILRPDGSIRFVDTRARVLPDGTLLAVIRDVTERHAFEAEREWLMGAIDQTAESVLVADADDRILYVNPAFEKMHQDEAGNLVGRHRRTVRRDLESPALEAAIDEALADGHSWSGAISRVLPDGSRAEHEVVISPIQANDGRVAGVVEVSRDVTREHALEAELAQARKMEAIGQLAGGVAHDFNNLLTAIGGFAELLALQLRPGTAGSDEVAQIQYATRRAAELTSRLLAFGRRANIQLTPLDLRMLVAEQLPLIRRLVGDDVVVSLAGDDRPAVVLADPGHMEQVLHDLAVNARDAMPDGGELRLAIETSNPEAALLAALDLQTGRRYVHLTVTDNGIGMDEVTRAHLFEPFFTTKGPGKGSGLGLAGVFGIVTASGGFLDVQSTLGAGATFHLYLPEVAAAAPSIEAPGHLAPDAPATPAAPEPEPMARATILLVEDEPAVRTFIRRALDKRGYRVLAFADPGEALAFATADLGAFDAVVTDLVMPTMSGTDLARRLAELRPDLPILLITGYDPEGEVAVLTAYLRKPFSVSELDAAVRAMLDRR